MALPLILAALGMVGAREGYAGMQRGQVAEAFRSAMGEGPGAYGGQGNLMEGEAAQVSPGSGLRGAFAGDARASALIELAGKMAGAPGVSGRDLLSIAGNIGEMNLRESVNSRTLTQQWEAMLSGQGHAADQQNRSFAQQDYSRLDSQEFEREMAGIREKANEAMRTGDRQHAFALARFHEGQQNARFRAELERKEGAGPKLKEGMRFFQLPGGGLTTGPTEGTKQYEEGIKDVTRGAQSLTRVDRLLESYLHRGKGREAIGKDSGLQAGLYAGLLSDIGRAQNAGVLNVGDFERIQKQYPSPAAFFDKLWDGDEYLLGIMGTLRNDLENSYKTARMAHPWAAGVPGAAPDVGPAPTRESVAEKFGGYASDDVAARLVPVGRQRARGRIRPAAQ